MQLLEAEIQVLASIEEAKSNNLPALREILDKRADRYWVFREDWSDAFNGLLEKGLITQNHGVYLLTDAGQPLATQYFAQRPDLYWYYYQIFFDLVARSRTHSKFCAAVYGEDWSQEGQTDMDCFNDLLEHMGITAGQHVIDLGCGAGGLSEYLRERFDVMVTGIDYSESAVRTALARTEGNRTNLDYRQGDLNSLELEPARYDSAISIDSIYWVHDMDKTISSILKSLKPAGKLGILIEHQLEGESDHRLLDCEHSLVAKSLDNLGIAYEVVDYSDMFLKFWPRAKRMAVALRDEYVAEGTELICDNWIREADDEYLPCVESNTIRRYLYLVTT